MRYINPTMDNTKHYVMTVIRGLSDFIYLLPFLFSLYRHPEPSRTFYHCSSATDMTYIPDQSSMTQYDVVASFSFRDVLYDALVVELFTIGCMVSSISIVQQLYFTLSLVFVYLLTIPNSSLLLSSLSFALSSEPLNLEPLNLAFTEPQSCSHRALRSRQALDTLPHLPPLSPFSFIISTLHLCTLTCTFPKYTWLMNSIGIWVDTHMVLAKVSVIDAAVIK